MEKCLVKKLKATVDNPNLPVLETMQQFTLNAIAKGGNMALTDGQKWALNHFFYEIGAISGSGIWNKIRTLFIPLIGIDKAHCGLDYKGDGYWNNPTIIKEQAGCIEYESDTYVTSNASIGGIDLSNPLNYFNSSILMCTAPGSYITRETKASIGFNYRTSEPKNYVRVFECGNSNNISAEARESTNNFSSRLYIDTQTEVIVAVCNFNNTHNTIYAIGGDEVLRDTAMNYGRGADNLPNTVSASSYGLAIGSGTKYGVIIDFSSALTESESLKVLNATNALRSTFV